MKGEIQVIERLNEALFLELGAVNQYWLHYRLLEDWGFFKLAKKEREESIEEMHHADKIIERIIFLEGHPNLQTVSPLRIGQNVREVLEADLAGEYDARTSYKKSREICQELGDYVTMNLFEDLLKDEEGHIDFLETQLDLLDFDRRGALRAPQCGLREGRRVRPWRMRRAPDRLRRAPFPGLAAALLAAALGPAVLAVSSADESPGLVSARQDLSAKDQARVDQVTRPTADFKAPEPFETLQGGAATSRKRVNQDAFSQSSANLTFEEEGTFKLGNGLFRKVWVSSPSSTQASDGLGPLFNARACQSCHLKDGRGHPPENGADATSMFLRLARQAETVEEQTAVAAKQVLNLPDPTYGSQLQDLAVPGLPGEGKMTVAYEERPVTLGDGSTVSLRAPTYAVVRLASGPMHPDTTLSPRVTPPMIGLGLVEQIHPADILAKADPHDRDGDGISGKASVVRDAATGGLALGRFGWKASTASIRQQTAEAFAGDMGISTPEMPKPWGDCTEAETACRALPTGVQPRLGDAEAPPPVMDLVTFYARNLAVPARRGAGKPEVLDGKRVFYGLGCVSCHTPKYVTRRDAPDKAQAFQLVWPYSDFLLHDMGEGLADGQQVGDADGREWRTPPLWGIGLTERVNGHTFFLHDGRARNLTEAILWHGGEATKARDGFAALPAKDRGALIAFLESL